RALAPDALRRALQAALLHWHDDAFLAGSPLAETLAPDAPAEALAEALRAAIGAALERARARARPQQALAYRAPEPAYVERAVSQERVAEQLAVSRTTFYRLPQRGPEG